MISNITIKNFKSIIDVSIPLGKINVFIGENGSGKSNILEALAIASCALAERTEPQDLFNKGIRIAKPFLMTSSFLGLKRDKSIQVIIDQDNPMIPKIHENITFDNYNNIKSKWNRDKTIYSWDKGKINEEFVKFYEKYFDDLQKSLDADKVKLNREIREKHKHQVIGEFEALAKGDDMLKYVIYNLNTNALRGFENISKLLPLGINGEGLDIFLSQMNKKEKMTLMDNLHISWIRDFKIDSTDVLKNGGYKLGRSSSQLYFIDKFMKHRNNIFSVENANEGVLYLLFYLSLFISKASPSFFAIDNIETALNPKLCRQLIKTLAKLSVENNKQALITTHNPSVLDGLNLNDPQQKLFIVKRTDEGYTKIQEVTSKPKLGDKNNKLSELWMAGYLGGIPNNF